MTKNCNIKAKLIYFWKLFSPGRKRRLYRDIVYWGKTTLINYNYIWTDARTANWFVSTVYLDWSKLTSPVVRNNLYMFMHNFLLCACQFGVISCYFYVRFLLKTKSDDFLPIFNPMQLGFLSCYRHVLRILLGKERLKRSHKYEVHVIIW